MTGGELAAPMQRNATAAIVNVWRVIAIRSYHFVAPVFREMSQLRDIAARPDRNTGPKQIPPNAK